MILIFLTSGLFLGWSLGANDAANLFGTAVSTRMLRFRTAAIIASVFVVLGAVVEGSGTTGTLGRLGSVNALAGAFTVALASGVTVTAMTRLKLPVSTSQAIIGGIVGWNLFSGSLTDYDSLTRILSTWILCPLISAVLAIIIYHIFKLVLSKARIHMLELDLYNRVLLIIVGAFGAYSLGANNIANVIGVFVNSTPFKPFWLGNLVYMTNARQLFLLGGIAISLGIMTYSFKVMKTVGRDLFRLSPITGLIVILAESLVLFMFASRGLQDFLISLGLPRIPLVPVSSSQAVIGAILGIAVAKGGRNINFAVLGKISTAWITTPVLAGLLTFISLFFMQNVFDQEVYEPVEYMIHKPVMEKLAASNIDIDQLRQFQDIYYPSAKALKRVLDEKTELDKQTVIEIIDRAELEYIILPGSFDELDRDLFSDEQWQALETLAERKFNHRWQFLDALAAASISWTYKQPPRENYLKNERLDSKFNYLIGKYKVSREIFEAYIS